MLHHFVLIAVEAQQPTNFSRLVIVIDSETIFEPALRLVADRTTRALLVRHFLAFRFGLFFRQVWPVLPQPVQLRLFCHRTFHTSCSTGTKLLASSV